jgi:hypothetical protein
MEFVISEKKIPPSIGQLETCTQISHGNERCGTASDEDLQALIDVAARL